MNLTSTSHMSFTISINGSVCFDNVNIHFTTVYAKGWSDPDFYNKLLNMDVCTKIEIKEKGITIFKN